MQTTLSRVKKQDKLSCKGELVTSLVRVNTSALEDYERLHQNIVCDTIKKWPFQKISYTFNAE